MNIRTSLGYLLISFLVVILVIFNSFFIVHQRQQALVFQFGEVVKVEKEPGLSFKIDSNG